MSDTNIFAVLRRPRRIWAVAAVHAEAERLRKIHQVQRTGTKLSAITAVLLRTYV